MKFLSRAAISRSSLNNADDYKNIQTTNNIKCVNLDNKNNAQTVSVHNANTVNVLNAETPTLSKEQYECVAKKRQKEVLMQIMSDKFHFTNCAKRTIFTNKIKPTLTFDLDTFLKKYDFSFEMYHYPRHMNFDGKVNAAHSEIRRRNPGAARTVKSFLRQKARERQPQTYYENKVGIYHTFLGRLCTI